MDPSADFPFLIDVVYGHPRLLCGDGFFLSLANCRAMFPGRQGQERKNQNRDEPAAACESGAMPWRSEPAAWSILRGEPS